MLKRVRNTQIGDIFAVPVNEREKRYIQYIISDLSQLNSDVIRAFKSVYPIDTSPAPEEIVSDEVDFYAHCVTKAGIKSGLWEKTGNTSDVGRTDHILFRDNNDYKNPDTWYVWHINGDFKRVGKLTEETKKAELGLVFQPESILHRLKTRSHRGIFANL
jgi:hypothetical protein